METPVKATRNTYAALFVVTLATLMYEILLTRIFSVTMWYHYGFMAISLAMFGMTAGALAVYAKPDEYAESRAKHHMAASALWFAVFAVASFLVHCTVPFVPAASLGGIGTVALTYAVLSLPFYFSGICVSVALTKFPRQVSKLYAADLAGAAAGCLFVVGTLKITDAPTAVFIVALLASLAAALFAAEGGPSNLRRRAVMVSALCAVFVTINTALVNEQFPLLRLGWTKQGLAERFLYEKWNPYSRIAVFGDPSVPQSPITEGISSTYPTVRATRKLFLTIDASAETTLTAFYGDLNSVDYLAYDVKNLVHYIQPDAKVLIVGAGGGRDILAALAFRQKSVRAVEMNEDILKTVNNVFGDFTGHLDRDPRVTFVNDEARSYLARLDEPFDIIQVSFIDTWAATAAGGLALTENSLYTLEAWELFLHHLTPRGVLSVSRWYIQGMPGEAYRLTALAVAALEQAGVANPREHLMLARNLSRQQGRANPNGAATILVSKQPFSAQNLDRLETVARNMQFDILLSPRFVGDPVLARLASATDRPEFTAGFPLDISPPTDDRPFFFNLMRPRDAFNPALWQQGTMSKIVTGVTVLAVLFGVVTVLCLLCFVVPLLHTQRLVAARDALPHLLFFAAIGFGFMLIEISQMQRLIIFLGHPTYGLSVVLFVLLLASGLGSYSTQTLSDPGVGTAALARLLLLLAVLMLFGVLTPRLIHAFQASTTPQRILLAGGMLFPLGVAMGVAFPLGLKLASLRSAHLTPWLWGINGATSVWGSVLAVAISLNSGISNSFWTGFAFYAVACGAFVWTTRKPSAHPAR